MRRKTKRGNRSRLGFERLEPRTMLAGDVFVFMDRGGNLQIWRRQPRERHSDRPVRRDHGARHRRGRKRHADQRRRERRWSTSRWSARGTSRFTCAAATTLSRVGERSDDVNAPDDLEIDTGHGNDTILITGDTNLGDDLEIESGSGNDLVDVRNVDVADDVEIETDKGDDVVKMLAVRIVDSTRINTGDGADRIYTEFEATFGGSLRIDTGSGDDFLQLTRAKFDGLVHVRMGSGNDGLCIENATFASEDTWFDGGRGDSDTWAINAATFAGDPLLGDITPRFEFSFDDCTFFEHFDPDPVSD